MTTKYLTTGSALLRGDGASPEVFTAIGGLYDLGGIGGGDTSEIEVSDFDSAAAEFLLDLPDEGEVTFSLFIDPANAPQDNLWTDRANKTLRNFRADFPGSPAPMSLSFAGYVKRYEHVASARDVWRANLTVRISGAVTRT